MAAQDNLANDEVWASVQEYLERGTDLVAGKTPQQAADMIAQVKQRITDVMSTHRWCEARGYTHANFVPQTREDCLNMLVWTLLHTFQGGMDQDGHARKVYGGYVRDWIMLGEAPNDVDFQLSETEYVLSYNGGQKNAFIASIQQAMVREWPGLTGGPRNGARDYYVRAPPPGGGPVPGGPWNAIPIADRQLAVIRTPLFVPIQVSPTPGSMSFLLTALSGATLATIGDDHNSDHGLQGIHMDCQRSNFLRVAGTDPGTPGDVDNLALIGNQGEALCWLGLKKPTLVGDTSPFSSLALSIYHAMTKQFVYYKDPTTSDGVERADRLTGRGWQCLNWEKLAGTTNHLIWDPAVGMNHVKACGTYRPRGCYPRYTAFAQLTNPHGAPNDRRSQETRWEFTCVLPAELVQRRIDGIRMVAGIGVAATNRGLGDAADVRNLTGWCTCVEEIALVERKHPITKFDKETGKINLARALLVKLGERTSAQVTTALLKERNVTTLWEAKVQLFQLIDAIQSGEEYFTKERVDVVLLSQEVFIVEQQFAEFDRLHGLLPDLIRLCKLLNANYDEETHDILMRLWTRDILPYLPKRSPLQHFYEHMNDTGFNGKTILYMMNVLRDQMKSRNSEQVRTLLDKLGKTPNLATINEVLQFIMTLYPPEIRALVGDLRLSSLPTGLTLSDKIQAIAALRRDRRQIQDVEKAILDALEQEEVDASISNNFARAASSNALAVKIKKSLAAIHAASTAGDFALAGQHDKTHKAILNEALTRFGLPTLDAPAPMPPAPMPPPMPVKPTLSDKIQAIAALVGTGRSIDDIEKAIIDALKTEESDAARLKDFKRAGVCKDLIERINTSSADINTAFAAKNYSLAGQHSSTNRGYLNEALTRFGLPNMPQPGGGLIKLHKTKQKYKKKIYKGTKKIYKK
jgi:hypothetical protein